MPSNSPTTATATFAGGCFWCVEHAFDEVKGVIETTSGYIGGTKENPTYKEVTAGGTGHVEAVEVAYDPGTVSYEELLDVFWRNIDPLDPDGQFCDRGSSYRSGIFYHSAEQKQLAEKSRQELNKSGRLPVPVVTKITKATKFYKAEEYHQGYYQKNPLRYKFYRFNCGRDKRLRELWN